MSSCGTAAVRPADLVDPATSETPPPAVGGVGFQVLPGTSVAKCAAAGEALVVGAARPAQRDDCAEVAVMEVDKIKVLEILRARGLEDRAVWVDRQFPDRIDVARNGGIFATLHIDPADLVDAAPPASPPTASPPASPTV
jgi:hypothetical protein